MLLVVSGEAAASYMVTPIGWAVRDDSRFIAVDLWVWVVHALAMPVFFWLSGYFARRIYVYGGGARLLRNRLTRVVVPLALAIVPSSLALDALWTWGHELAGRSASAAGGAVSTTAIAKLVGSQPPLTLGHLWYLYYLLVVSAVAAVAAALTRRLRIAAPRSDGILPLTFALAVLPLAIAGILQPAIPVALRVDPVVTIYYGAFFAWGWMVHAARDQLVRYARHAWHFALVAAGLLAVVLPSLYEGRAPLYAITASAGFTLATVAAFLGLCVRYVRRHHRSVELAADASYWVYLVHLPLVVVLQIGFAQLSWPGPVEYLAIVAIALVCCFGSYALWIGARRWGLPATKSR